MLSNMTGKLSCRLSLNRISAVFILSFFAACVFSATIRAEDRTVFNNSLVASGIGVASRDVMTAADMSVQVEFMVALKMRSLEQLSARIAQGELISADEMAAKYYPLDTDYQAQVNWLKSQGLTIVSTDPCRLGIFVSGTAAQVQLALQTSFAKVSANGQTYTSAIASPSLPTAIAAPVLGINGLQPHIQAHKHSIKKDVSVGSRQNNAPPYYPSEILKAYSGSGLAVNGSGQTIGIVIDTFPSTTDLTSFWNQAGVSQSLGNVSMIQVVSGTLPAPSGEESLDAEWTSGIASGAKIRIYAARDLAFNHLDQCYQRILNDLPSNPTLHQVSISLGLDEADTGVSQMQTDAQYFASLAAGGVSVFVSTGDDGSHPSSSGNNLGPLQVEYPSSDPSVTGVGGTSINLSSSNGTVSSESAWSDGGGGISGQFSRPSFQVGSSLPSGSMRLVPDVAAPADPDTGALVFLSGSSQQFGGTSWSAPTWAGFCAMINQARATAGLPPVGLLGKSIYPLLGTSSFRDITSGNNGPNGQYNAATGFDLCTGIGVPNISNLITALSQNGTPPPPTLPNLTNDASVSVTLPSAVTVGGNLTVSTGVLNNGTAAAGSFIVRYRLSTSQNFDTSGAALGDVTVASLAVNGKATATFTGACPNVAAGSYFLVWSIDATNTVAESNESDNIFSSSTQIAVTSGSVSRPNLTLDSSAAVVAPTSVAVGANLTVSTGVLNNGTAAAGSFIVRYRLSTSQNFDTSGAALGDASVSSLAVIGKATATFSGVCPNVAPGSYFLVWSIDATNAVTESNESDNIFFASTAISVTSGQTGTGSPNLTLDPNAPIVCPDTLIIGAPLTISTGVLNNDTGAAGQFIVRYRLSTDTLYSPNSDALIGDASINGLSGGATATATFTGNVPDVTPGTYYLVWSIDPLGQVSESNENDNLWYRVKPVTVANPSLPNLTLDTSAPIVVPTTVTIGGSITVTTSVLNNGGTDATQFSVRYRLSVDTTYSPNSDTFLGDVNLTGLAAGASTPATLTTPLPSIAPGNYYLVWSIDPFGEVDESNENDNLFYSTTVITVGNGAVNHAPVIVSGPSFSPLSPAVNTTVAFSVAASDADNNPLTYSWNFGDGASGSGASPSHVYTSSGSYTASVTVTDGKGGSTSGSVTVTVSSANSVSTAVKKAFTLNFARGNDTLDLAIYNSAFSGWVANGETIRVVVGTETLDAGVFFRNKASGANGTFTFNTRSGTIEYISRSLSLQNAVAPYGAVNANISGKTIHIPMFFSVGGQSYGNTYAFTYSATQGRSGKGN